MCDGNADNIPNYSVPEDLRLCCVVSWHSAAVNYDHFARRVYFLDENARMNASTLALLQPAHSQRPLTLASRESRQLDRDLPGCCGS